MMNRASQQWPDDHINELPDWKPCHDFKSMSIPEHDGSVCADCGYMRVNHEVSQ